MHTYLYDREVNNNSFAKSIARIETRLTDLGLNGKIIRLGVSELASETVEHEIKRGAKTIVVVGGAVLFSQTLNIMAKLRIADFAYKKIPLGLISTNQNIFTKFLGLHISEAACDILAARRIQKFNLGEANHQVFLTQASITTQETRLEIDEEYTIEITEKGEVLIVNSPTSEIPDKNLALRKLALFIKTNKSKRIIPFGSNLVSQSMFNFRTLNIYNKNSSVLLDDAINVATPVTVKLANDPINLIIGKERTV